MTLMWSNLCLVGLMCLKALVCAKQVLRETSAFAEKEFNQIDIFRGPRSRERINLSVPGKMIHELYDWRDFDEIFLAIPLHRR